MEEININQIEIDGKHYNFKQFDANENNFTMIVDARSRHLRLSLRKIFYYKNSKNNLPCVFHTDKGTREYSCFQSCH